MIPALTAQGVKVIEIGSREYGAACGNFYDAVVGKDDQGKPVPRLVHRGQVGLRAAVEAGRQRTLGDAWAWHRRTSRSDITPLVAATLAFHGAAKPSKPVDRRVLVFG